MPRYKVVGPNKSDIAGLEMWWIRDTNTGKDITSSPSKALAKLQCWWLNLTKK